MRVSEGMSVCVCVCVCVLVRMSVVIPPERMSVQVKEG